MLIRFNTNTGIPSCAKAQFHFAAFTAQLKSYSFKTELTGIIWVKI
jgi:hypothetical protein